MTSLVDSDRALLGFRHHLGLLLQTADDAIYGIEEVLLTYCLTIVTGSYQGSLITNVSDVGTRESWCLTSQEVDVYRVVELQGFQVYVEDLLTLVEVRQVNMYLTIETTSTQQR